MNDDNKSDAFVDESMQCLAHLRGHIINIFKALNKIESVIESMQSRINKIEADMKEKKDDIEKLKECLSGVEAKTILYGSI